MYAFQCSGKIIPKESKHWVQMPKLYVQLKKAPPFSRWKSLEAPLAPSTTSQPSITEMPRMGSKDSSKMDSPNQTSRSTLTNGPTATTRLLPSGPQNVAKPVDKPKNSPLGSGAGNAAAAVKAGTVVKLVDTCYTGLINIGNTCYMNSIIQSLSNTQELRDYLIRESVHSHRSVIQCVYTCSIYCALSKLAYVHIHTCIHMCTHTLTHAQTHRHKHTHTTHTYHTHMHMHTLHIHAYFIMGCCV